MTPDQMTRYRGKAATAACAWLQLLGAAPTRHALVLSVAVADLETGLGSVKGRNWGAVHKRMPNADESSILLGHGVFPTGDESLATARGLLAPTQAPDEVLVIDRNALGPYFVWLWAFKSDLDAAKKFLQSLVIDRPSVRGILDSASPTSLAAAMYASRYFEGTSADPKENIRAYAARLETSVARIESALLGWPPANASADAPCAAQSADGAGPVSALADQEAATASSPNARAGAGWWIAGAAALGLGLLFLGRRP